MLKKKEFLATTAIASIYIMSGLSINGTQGSFDDLNLLPTQEYELPLESPESFVGKIDLSNINELSDVNSDVDIISRFIEKIVTSSTNLKPEIVNFVSSELKNLL